MSKRARAGTAAAIAAAAAALPASASAAVALRVAEPAATVTLGTPATLAGTVDSDEPSRDVRLLELRWPYTGTWRQAAVANALTSGEFEFRVRSPLNARYRAVAEFDSGADEQSPVRQLWVRPRSARSERQSGPWWTFRLDIIAGSAEANAANAGMRAAGWARDFGSRAYEPAGRAAVRLTGPRRASAQFRVRRPGLQAWYVCWVIGRAGQDNGNGNPAEWNRCPPFGRRFFAGQWFT